MERIAGSLFVVKAVTIEGRHAEQRRTVTRALVAAAELRDLALVEHALEVGDRIGVLSTLFIQLARTEQRVVEERPFGIGPARRDLNERVAGFLRCARLRKAQRDLIRDGL